MTPDNYPVSKEFNKEKFFKETAVVVVIDDRGGSLLEVGDMTRAVCESWAKSSILFHVKGIEGETAQEKISNFRIRLEAVVPPETKNIIFVLDRDLGIGNLPLSDLAKKSVAADIDKNNDGPALVPHIRKWFNNAPIVGFTGEGDTTGMSEVYSGTRVVQKPDYARLKLNLVEAYSEAYAPKLKLEEESLRVSEML